jgi:hypothetical protein
MVTLSISEQAEAAAAPAAGGYVSGCEDDAENDGGDLRKRAHDALTPSPGHGRRAAKTVRTRARGDRALRQPNL